MRTLIIFVLLICFCMGCGSFGGPDDPGTPEPDAIIRELMVTPDPVIVGDTLNVKVILADDPLVDLEFTWIFPQSPTSPRIQVSSQSDTKWVVDLSPGNYEGAVTVDDTSTFGRAATQAFLFTVETAE